MCACFWVRVYTVGGQCGGKDILDWTMKLMGPSTTAPCALQATALFTHSAQFICLAFALQQHKAIYRTSLNVVKQARLGHGYG